MEAKSFLAVFVTIFLAELGDKTQLATVLFASRSSESVITVFLAASSALVLSSAIAVVVGSRLSDIIDPRYLSYLAGTGFVLIGAWTIVTASAA